MSDAYSQFYEEFKESMQPFEEDQLFSSLSELLHSSRNTFAFNRKLMQKAIDVSWVEAIENGLIHVDNVLRTPRRTIEDVEEIVPIALSRKITVESVKHLAQHTDLIQSVDKKTGKITPSKILNVHKEESLMTYENKFVNTLIDRLYIFISTRYEKLAQVAKDEEIYSLGYDTSIDDGAGGLMKIQVKIETTDSLDDYDASGYTVWQRVEKIKKAIEGYKGSELCTKLGNSFIRPPVMRTNAIMKNVDLKACLTLWQYIESYDKVGYEINIEDTAVKPQGVFVEDFYQLVMLHLLLFRTSMGTGKEELKTIKTKHYAPKSPKFVKKFDRQLSGHYDVSTEGVAGYISADGEFQIKPNLPKNINLVLSQINAVLDIEQNYQAEQEEKRRQAQLAAEEEERKRLEQERIEAARQAELERIRAEKEAEERRVQEMLERKRAEQEAERLERERIEQERLAMLEEQRKREEERQRREEEERLRREEEERIAAERERIAGNKQLVRAELGEAEGIDEDKLAEKQDDTDIESVYNEITDEEIEQVTAEAEEEFEDPRAVAAKMKLEQQKREKERAEAERAQRLKAERQYFENKPFREIYKEYSWNPIYLIPRLIRHILAMVFGFISEDTDNPDYKTRRAEIAEKRRIAAEEKLEREKMEVYYRKYAQTFKYRFMRSIDDRKFKKKKRKEARGKPKPVYNPPKRTPEETAAIREEMQRLYAEYHVSGIEKLRRWFDEIKRKHTAKERDNGAGGS